MKYCMTSLIFTYLITLKLLKRPVCLFQLITDGNLLYIMNEKGLEIYSSRCNAAAIHNSEDWNGITKVNSTSTCF